MQPRKILLFVVNTPEFFLSHRSPVAVAAKEHFDVRVATAFGPGIEKIRAMGMVHYAIPMTRSGLNPFNEIQTLIALRSLFQTLRPSIIHLVTIKPIIFGGLAARMTKVPGIVAAVSGLGSVFSSDSRWLRMIVERLYRAALQHRNIKVIFQNSSDRDVLVQVAGIADEKTEMVAGSGIDLDSVSYAPPPCGMPIVVFASRLLREKGIYDFVMAAQTFNSSGKRARFVVAGLPDPGNPSSVSEKEVENWKAEGHVEVLGFCDDIPALYARSHIVCLPSYYGEGIPKALIEAAAVGRPIITTNLPGCRDTVISGQTGLLVPPKSPDSIVAAIDTLLKDSPRREEMGRRARAFAEQRFSLSIIVARHLEIYAGITRAL